MISYGERTVAFGIATLLGVYSVYFVLIMPEPVTPALIFMLLIALRGSTDILPNPSWN
jgi:hypothetical protein